MTILRQFGDSFRDLSSLSILEKSVIATFELKDVGLLYFVVQKGTQTGFAHVVLGTIIGNIELKRVTDRWIIISPISTKLLFWLYGLSEKAPEITIQSQNVKTTLVEITTKSKLIKVANWLLKPLAVTSYLQ